MKRNELTRQGLMDLNLMEANEWDGDPWDLWVTLLSLGYNKALEMTEVGESQSKNHCTFFCCTLCVCHRLIAGGQGSTATVILLILKIALGSLKEEIFLCFRERQDFVGL